SSAAPCRAPPPGSTPWPCLDPPGLSLVLCLPPDRVGFFFKHQQRRGLRQRRLFPPQFLLQGRDPLLLRVFLASRERLQFHRLDELGLPPSQVHIVQPLLPKKHTSMFLRKLFIAQDSLYLFLCRPIFRPSLFHTLSVGSQCNIFTKPSREGGLRNANFFAQRAGTTATGNAHLDDQCSLHLLREIPHMPRRFLPPIFPQGYPWGLPRRDNYPDTGGGHRGDSLLEVLGRTPERKGVPALHEILPKRGAYQ